MPDECASIRSMARWVLPVLVGPSTAVTPAPGACRWTAWAEKTKKAMFFRYFRVADCQDRDRLRRFRAALFDGLNRVRNESGPDR